jgi:hypothetical protein
MLIMLWNTIKTVTNGRAVSVDVPTTVAHA